ncbi:apolipoprotein D-like [Ruditapes philippinarum]|uniref:apolipoprotein D-like n=1 Tax=Ruditapes philippinarum TaxID=129788 RepID=UPI00295BCB77|nr:apolipoprotein D-like [Ruditapes philippinarum]
MASCWIFVVGITLMFGLVGCQFVTLGSCPEVRLQENFDLDRYLGKWYENRRYSNWFSLFSNCVSAEYKKTSDTSVQVNNTGWLYLNDKVDTIIGEAVVQDNAKLGVRFSEFAPYGDYWVLSTDYINYSVVWSCSESPKGAIQFNSQYLWVLTRTREGVSEAELKRILGILEDYGININERKLKPTTQTNCFSEIRM